MKYTHDQVVAWLKMGGDDYSIERVVRVIESARHPKYNMADFAFSGMTTKEMAKAWGISRTRVQQRRKRQVAQFFSSARFLMNKEAAGVE